MSSSHNSVVPYSGGTVRDAFESLGITQFPSETEWYQVLGGLIVQGGTVEVASSTTATIDLVAPYEKQFLGAWIQVLGGFGNTAHTVIVDLDSFQIVNGEGARTYYWLSLGV